MAFHHRPETFAAPAAVGVLPDAEALQARIDAEFARIATLLVPAQDGTGKARPTDAQRRGDMRAIVSAWRMRRSARCVH